MYKNKAEEKLGRDELGKIGAAILESVVNQCKVNGSPRLAKLGVPEGDQGGFLPPMSRRTLLPINTEQSNKVITTSNLKDGEGFEAVRPLQTIRIHIKQGKCGRVELNLLAGLLIRCLEKSFSSICLSPFEFHYLGQLKDIRQRKVLSDTKILFA